MRRSNLPKIALVGAEGQVGHELQMTLGPLGDLVCLNRAQLDLSDPASIPAVLDPLSPDVIVNAAAYTAVDRAESEPELAQLINGEAPTQMARTAQRLGAQLIHISTDYVFDGVKGIPYGVDDVAQPQGVYGHSKRAGEVGIQAHCDRHWILRTAWVYGTYGQGNFVKTMLRLGAERPELRVVADQVGTPTWSRSIAEAIACFIQSLDGDTPAPSGLYHFTNSGVASWYDFAVAIFEEAAQLGMTLKVANVIPITTADYPTPAQRPHYSVLSLGKITPILGQPPLHWRTALRKMLQELQTA